MQTTLQSNGNVSIILDANLNADNSSEMREHVRDALARTPRELIFDCGKLIYIDSTGLGLLMLARAESVKLGCKVRLANLISAHVREIMDHMQFQQLFEMSGPLNQAPAKSIPSTSVKPANKLRPSGVRVVR
jgi:anti-anti-sigma factor